MSRSEMNRHMVEDEDSIIAGLSHDVAFSILARVPCVYYPRLRCVCRTWNNAFRYSGSVISYRRALGILEAWPLVRICRENKPFRWYAIDPHRLSSHRIPSPSSIHIEDVAGSELCIFAAYRFDLCAELHFHCFDASSMQWQHAQVPAMHSDRFKFTSVILDNYWYVMGGHSKNPRSVERIYIGNPSMLSSWECVPDMHCARMYSTAISRQGCLYVLGGRRKLSGQWTEIYSGEVWNPRRGEWTLVPQLWPFKVFGDHPSDTIAIAVVMGALFALKKLSRELMCYYDDKQEWVNLGQVPLENAQQFRKLLGVGSELWLVSQCKTDICDAHEFWFEVCIFNAASLSGSVCSPPPELSWRISCIKFDGKMDVLQGSVAHM